MDRLAWVADPTLAKRLRATIESIPLADNQDCLDRFLRSRLNAGNKPQTLLNEANALRQFGVFLGPKRFQDATDDDVGNFLAQAAHRREWRTSRADGAAVVTARTVALAPSTQAVRRGIIRTFLKHLHGENDPRALAIKIKRKHIEAVPAEGLIEADDLARLLDANPKVRDRAILALLHETGLRANELCQLNVGSLTFDDDMVTIRLPRGADGLKTGARELWALDCIPYLLAWLEVHPDKHNAKAPLFVGLEKKRRGQRLNANYLSQLTTQAGRRAGLAKRTNPHTFRHTAATNKARDAWPEVNMRSYFGWSPTSSMPQRYVHLTTRDHKARFRRSMGLDASDAPETRPLKARTCPACGKANPMTNARCEGCNRPIHPDAMEMAKEAEDRRLSEKVAMLLAHQYGVKLRADPPSTG